VGQGTVQQTLYLHSYTVLTHHLYLYSYTALYSHTVLTHQRTSCYQLLCGEGYDDICAEGKTDFQRVRQTSHSSISPHAGSVVQVSRVCKVSRLQVQ
jgi:hypothetical protein